MENHPIPQDVTGFQFKLIGNMTVKQFAYLATGCIFAIILYYAPVFLLLKLFFIPLFAGSGAALAFLPIDGRPLDVMVSQLIKALVSPNQYVYRKVGTHFAFTDFRSRHMFPHPLHQSLRKKNKKKRRNKHLLPIFRPQQHKNNPLWINVSLHFYSISSILRLQSHNHSRP
jgi:hypothetical protein